MPIRLLRRAGDRAGVWRSTHVPGSSLTEEALRAMWRFRLGIFELKPTCDPEADWRAFADYCRQSQIVTRLFDSAGALQGMVVMRWQTKNHGGKPYTVLLPEFMFLTPAARQRTILPRMYAEVTARCVPVLLSGPTYLAGFGYPSGFLSADRLVGRMHFRDEPHGDALVAHIFDTLVTLAGDRWIAERAVKDMPTLPRTLTARWATAQGRHPRFNDYIARCPDWAEGYTLPLVGRVTLQGAFARLTRRFARRWARRSPSPR